MNRLASNIICNAVVRGVRANARSINFYSHLRVRDLSDSSVSDSKKTNSSSIVNYDHIVDISINDPNFEVSYHNNNGRTYRISIKQEVSMNLENGYCEEVSVNTKTVPKDDSEQ